MSDPVIGSQEWWTALDEWLTDGQKRGFVGAVVCAVHEGLPLTAAEEAEYEEHGEPPCHPAVRLINPSGPGDVPYELLTKDTQAREMSRGAAVVVSSLECVVCGSAAEVWHPDHNGGQLGFCGEHEPEAS
jgi:hypothetical protein